MRAESFGVVRFSFPNNGVFGVLGVFGVFGVSNAIFACERFTFSGVRSSEPLLDLISFSVNSATKGSFSLFEFCILDIFWKVKYERSGVRTA